VEAPDPSPTLPRMTIHQASKTPRKLQPENSPTPDKTGPFREERGRGQTTPQPLVLSPFSVESSEHTRFVLPQISLRTTSHSLNTNTRFFLPRKKRTFFLTCPFFRPAHCVRIRLSVGIPFLPNLPSDFRETLSLPCCTELLLHRWERRYSPALECESLADFGPLAVKCLIVLTNAFANTGTSEAKSRQRRAGGCERENVDFIGCKFPFTPGSSFQRQWARSKREEVEHNLCPGPE